MTPAKENEKLLSALSMKKIRLSGIVKSHSGRGTKLGFPTANIDLAEDIPDGIYVGFTTVENHKLSSLIFIGTPEMFGETEKKAEIYILDFDEDLYGKTRSEERRVGKECRL